MPFVLFHGNRLVQDFPSDLQYSVSKTFSQISSSRPAPSSSEEGLGGGDEDTKTL